VSDEEIASRDRRDPLSRGQRRGGSPGRVRLGPGASIEVTQATVAHVDHEAPRSPRMAEQNRLATAALLRNANVTARGRS
jgi:hypothetical protein